MNFSNGIYNSASDFYKSVFGKKVYKVSVDAGCTCPNRDGTKGYGGCIFCSQNGSGDFIKDRRTEIKNQIEKNKAFVIGKIKNPAFIAYFQSFTNTYGNPDELNEMYCQALKSDDVVGIAIGTRPDCINDEILSHIKKISEKKFVMIELGLQTSNEKSAEYINRCYKNETFIECVQKLKKECPKVHVVCHLIFGIPGETEKDMLSSVRFAVKSKIDGIKISLLYVLQNTRLAEDYFQGKFNCLEMDSYFQLLGKALKIIPENLVIHRLTGDGPKNLLIAPEWTENKRHVLNSLTKYLKDNHIVQGMEI